MPPRRSARNVSCKSQTKRPSHLSSPDHDRQIKRQKSSQGISSTSKTSKYFDEEKSSESPEGDQSSALSDAASADVPSRYGDSASGAYNGESGAESTGVSDTAEEEDLSDRKKVQAKGKRTGRETNSSGKQGKDTFSTTGRELWREGVKAGLGPGKEVFIKLPGPRDEGGIPYEDGTIHPNTLAFLKDLKQHNERAWLKRNDADYRKSKKDWDTFVESFNDKIVEKDDTIPELPAKDLVFRIYRDVRFSNDPTPYKPHFSAAWSRTGKKGPYAAYYLHLEPGKCFVGAGLWMPDAGKLASLRQDMDQNPHRIKAVLAHPDVRREIFGGIPNDEEKAVKAFVSQNKEGALKTKPKGYSSDNKNIELLRLRSFTLNKGLPDKDLLGPEALDKVAHIVGVMASFVTYLNSVVMPDPVNDDDDDEEGETDEEDEDGEEGSGDD